TVGKPTAPRLSVMVHSCPPLLFPPCTVAGLESEVEEQLVRQDAPGSVVNSPRSQSSLRTMTRQRPVKTISQGGHFLGGLEPGMEMGSMWRVMGVVARAGGLSTMTSRKDALLQMLPTTKGKWMRACLLLGTLA